MSYLTMSAVFEVWDTNTTLYKGNDNIHSQRILIQYQWLELKTDSSFDWKFKDPIFFSFTIKLTQISELNQSVCLCVNASAEMPLR